MEAKRTMEESLCPHKLGLFLRNPDLTFSTLVSSFTLWAVPGHVQFPLGIEGQF